MAQRMEQTTMIQEKIDNLPVGGSIDYESWAVHTRAREIGLKPATVRLIWMLRKFNRYTRFLMKKERVRL